LLVGDGSSAGVQVSLTSFMESVLAYRSVFLMNQLHNLVFGDSFVPTVKLCGLLILYISAFAVTVLRSVIHPIFFSIFLLYMCVLGVIIIAGASLTSQVYNNSRNFHLDAQRALANASSDNFDRVVMRKTLKSLPVMKSNVGSFYYMEGRAKLTFLDNLARGIQFMLVTFK
jgi:hypothetical protein